MANQHQLALHAALAQQLVSLPGLRQWKSLRNERLDLLLLKQVK